MLFFFFCLSPQADFPPEAVVEKKKDAPAGRKSVAFRKESVGYEGVYWNSHGKRGMQW